MALENIKRLAAEGKPITLGYFGGSITEGAGASSDEHTWRALTTAYFRRRFPQCPVTEINAGIGGTGSFLGMFRIKRDLLSKKPDLVFVEFAVNDFGRPAEPNALCMEGIVRQILKECPQTDILFVFTTQKTMYEIIRQGNTVGSIDEHQKVASHYGIETVNMGETINTRIAAGDGDWNTYTQDCCHPNDYGYSLYADCLTGRIDYLLTHEGAVLRDAGPMSENSFLNADMLDASEFGGNFRLVEQSLCGRYPHYAEGKDGENFTIRTHASCFGLYYMNAHDTGDILYSIDGDEKSLRLWDEYAMQFDRAHDLPLLFDAGTGEHTLTIKAAGTKDDRSQGSFVRIGALLLAERAE